jgi:hyperosmotically inducible periplasmic protein
MKQGILGTILMATALVATAGAAGKENIGAPRTDADVAKAVRHEILMYPRYTLWDDVSFRVENGSVELLGAVNQPYKKSDLEKIVQHVPGVTAVTNEIKVLPLSTFDDRLRLQVANAIYRDPTLSRYAMGAVPSIHIIVDNGHVTLTGAVNSDMEKQIAGMRASGAGLGFGAVVNKITVDNPHKKS